MKHAPLRNTSVKTSDHLVFFSCVKVPLEASSKPLLPKTDVVENVFLTILANFITLETSFINSARGSFPCSVPWSSPHASSPKNDEHAGWTGQCL